MRNSGPESYRPIEDVGFDVERAAWEAGYSTWVEWASDDLEAAYKAMDSAGEVVDPSTDSG
jgi:hypothetical protein